MKKARIGYALLPIVVLLGLTAAPAGAATYTSNQAGYWDNPVIWTPAGPPGPNDSAIVMHNVELDSVTAETAMSVTINPGGRLYSAPTDSFGFYVKRTLRNDGHLIFQKTSMTSTTISCTLSVGDSFINGSPGYAPIGQCSLGIHKLFVYGAMYNRDTLYRKSGGSGASTTIKGGVVNDGTIIRSSTTGYQYIWGGFTNNGRWTNYAGDLSVNVYTGDFINTGPLYYGISTTGSAGCSLQVSSGNFNNSGTFNTCGAVIVSVGTFTNSGTYAQLSQSQTRAVTLAGLATNTSSGTITRTGGAAWTLNGGLTNYGTYTASGAYPLTVNGTFTDSGGTFTNGSSVLTCNGDFSNTGTATFNPGSGGLTCNGNFLNTATATFNNSGNGNLTFNGDFTNDQPSPDWGTGT